ncbi:MAG: carboxypeptidase regulatory-like domain-containing protein [bacterium]
MFNKTIALALFLLFIASITTAPLEASPSWSTPEPITASSIVATFPDIAIDEQGVTHVVFQEGKEGNFSINYMQKKGSTWSTPQRISQSDKSAQLPRIRVGLRNSKTVVGIVYKAKKDKNSDSRIYYKESTDGGKTWGEVETTTSEPSFEPDMVFDSIGNPHITCMYQKPNDDYSIGYVGKSNNTWSALEDVSTGSKFDFKTGTSITTTKSNSMETIHISYIDQDRSNNSNNTLYYTSKSGNQQWEASKQIHKGKTSSSKLLSNKQSELYLVWSASPDSNNYNYEPYFSSSPDSGKTWTPAKSIGNNQKLLSRNPALAISKTGTLIAIWEEQIKTSQDSILSTTSTNKGKAWKSIETLRSNNKRAREAEISTNDKSFGAVWHDDGESLGSWRIYYSSIEEASSCSSERVSGTIAEKRSAQQTLLFPFFATSPTPEFTLFPLVLDGVTVTLSTSSGKGQEAVTDSTGAFSFDIPSEGTYLLNFEKSGYQPSTASFTFTGQELTGQFLLCLQNQASCPENQSDSVKKLCEPPPTPAQTPDNAMIWTAMGTLNTDSLAWGKYLSFLLTWLYSIAGTVSVLNLVRIGARLTTAGGNKQALVETKRSIQKIVFALILIFSSWVLVSLVGGINLLQWTL